MTLENQYIAALEQAETYTISGTDLHASRTAIGSTQVTYTLTT